MGQAAKVLSHSDSEKKEDSALREEQLAFLAKAPELQLVGELSTKLRALALPWWTPAQQREKWSASTRMGWFAQRPGLRQRITTTLTGLPPNAAKKKTPDFQGGLIDSVLDEGDITVVQFEATFDPFDIVVYGPAAELWRSFRERMPWTQDTAVHQELIAWLLRALLSDSGDLSGIEGDIPARKRTPILTPWDVRTAINGRVWHTHMPVDVRVEIDEARFRREKEKPREAFHAKDDLAIALPEVITKNIPLAELRAVFAAAEKAMGFEPPPAPAEPEPRGGRSERPPASAKADGETKADAKADAEPAKADAEPAKADAEPAKAETEKQPEKVESIAPTPSVDAQGASTPVPPLPAPSSPPAAAAAPAAPASVPPPAGARRNTIKTAVVPPGPGGSLPPEFGPTDQPRVTWSDPTPPTGGKRLSVTGHRIATHSSSAYSPTFANVAGTAESFAVIPPLQ